MPDSLERLFKVNMVTSSAMVQVGDARIKRVEDSVYKHTATPELKKRGKKCMLPEEKQQKWEAKQLQDQLKIQGVKDAIKKAKLKGNKKLIADLKAQKVRLQ